MMNMKRILALCLTLALGVGMMAGCSKKEEGAATSTPAASSTPSSSASTSTGTEEKVIDPMDLSTVTDISLATTGLPGDTVVATVGGIPVTAKNLVYWLNYDISYTLQQYYYTFGVTELTWDAVDSEGVTTEESILESALQMAAYYAMVPEQAARDGVKLPDDIDELLAADKATIISQVGGEETATYYFWLNMMEEDLFEELYKGGLLVEGLLEHHFGEGSEGYPTDAEAAAYAEDVMGAYSAKHILLLTKNMEDGSALDDATIAQQKALADDLLAKLKASKDPVTLFDNLMNEYSEDSGLAANPNGYDAYKGQMVPEFENAALALKVGEFSEVVESDYGYHIILRLPLDLTEFRATYTSRKMQEKVDQWLEEYGTQTNEAYGKIDPEEFWNKANSLQKAAYDHVSAVMEAKQAQG